MNTDQLKDRVQAELASYLEGIEPPDTIEEALALFGNHLQGLYTKPEVLEEKLTPREMEALKGIAKGLKYREIADEMTIGANSVRNYLENVYEKLGVRNRTEAVVLAKRMNLV